ncbi:MAG TPA: Ku protein [Segetibacter sp.]|jgi:DNA end-binding protein Ku
MRSIWTGAIGFGLVNIPIKMYSATQRSELNLDMLDKKDMSHIKYQRVNEKTGKEVTWENIVKGYKLNDQYVILTDKDFESANAKKTKTIEISEFVNEDEIDSVYFETPYYLEPDKSGERAYALLREALRKTKKVGVATFVMRSKEGLAILRANEKVIILNRIRFAEEVRDTSELNLPEAPTIKKAELDMAISLINQLTSKFDISGYKDTYTEQLMKVINDKAKGVKVKAPQMKVVHSEKGDLMSALKASLDVKKKKAS